MVFRSSISFLVFFYSTVVLSEAEPGWVSLPLTGPNGIRELGSAHYYVNNILVGTPPATESLLLNIASSVFAVHSESCVFCPGANLFNPALSSTYKSKNQTQILGSKEIASIPAQDTISFGGVLTRDDVPINLILRMAQYLQGSRFLGGHWGTFVNTSENAQTHILTRLHDSGSLLNPVVGMRLGNTPKTSRISIGALDPSDFEGTMNWVPAESVGAPLDAATIKLDGIRGFGGSLLPYEKPLLAHMDSLTAGIFVPNAWTYMHSPYVGPINAINVDSAEGAYSFICNETQAYVHLSIDINGINYQIDSQDNVLRNNTPFGRAGYCNVGIHNFTRIPPNPVSARLGIPFLRSVYLAYRFPTKECPTAYYGFAFPKSANRTSSMIAQQPRETPSASAQCLSFAMPTSTPTVSTPPPQVSAEKLLSAGTYNVWSDSSGRQVRLKGVDELVAGVVRGVVTVED